MSEVYHVKLTISPMQFETMMQADDVKKYFKERLAVELAHKLIESKRTQYTYTRDTIQDFITLNARVEL
jgi:hypothetical protein